MNTAKDPFYLYDLPLSLAWIRNIMPGNVCEKMICPLPNFNNTTGEVLQLINNLIPRRMIGVITYPCRN